MGHLGVGGVLGVQIGTNGTREQSEMPVIILTLVKIGVLNYQILKSARRYVIVIAFVLGAILTTPEVITQVLMAIPLLLMYEISVWVAWYWERQEKKRELQA